MDRFDTLRGRLADAVRLWLILGVLALGAWLDSGEAEPERTTLACTATHPEVQRLVVDGSRAAFQHGLDECADRERFARQQFLQALDDATHPQVLATTGVKP